MDFTEGQQLSVKGLSVDILECKGHTHNLRHILQLFKQPSTNGKAILNLGFFQAYLSHLQALL